MAPRNSSPCLVYLIISLLLVLLATLAIWAWLPASLDCAPVSLPGWRAKTTQLCANLPLDQPSGAPSGAPNPAITTAVIVIVPGNNTGGGINRAAAHAGRTRSTLILAPTLPDSPTPDPNGLYWDGNWRFGGLSLNPGAPVSSFTIIDALVDLAADRTRYPNLSQVVITGFSAGGQLVNRYAALNGKQPSAAAATRSAIHFRYVVGAPGLYLYLDNRRRSPSLQAFITPDPAPCSYYNQYPFGLAGEPVYPWTYDPAQVRSQFFARQVVYLVGQSDNDPADPSLSGGCAAAVQGPSRLERARWYFAHLQNHYGSRPPGHYLVEVPGLGHTTAVYDTPAGRQALFEEPPAAP